MVKCSVYMCESATYKNIPGITFHRFPKDKIMCDAWLKNLNLSSWTPNAASVICSRHFEEHLFKRNNTSRTRLLQGAIPKIIEEYFQSNEAQNHPEASTSGACEARHRLDAEVGASTSLKVDSDEEPAERDAGGGAESHAYYTSSKESQKGRFRLSGGAGSAGSLLRETPTHSLQELLMDLHEISDKIQNFCPSALRKQFTLTFKGEDGDMSEYTFTSASETRRSGQRHGGLSCDECGSEIIGFRYKCVSCADYDLCSACEALGTHADHLMMRIAKPLKMKQARTLLRRWCEAMKPAGVTTTDEITGATDTAEPDTGEPDTSATEDPDNIAPVEEASPKNTKRKVVKTNMLEGKVQKSKRTRARLPRNAAAIKKKMDSDTEEEDEEDDGEAKKRKIVSLERERAAIKKNMDSDVEEEEEEEDSKAKKRERERAAIKKKTDSDTEEDEEKEEEAKKRKLVTLERDGAGEMSPVKEEPLDNDDLTNYYSSFAETEPTVQVEDVKVEDPDPLGIDNIVKTEKTEDASSAARGEMEENASTPAPTQTTTTSIKTYTHRAAR